MPRQPLSLTLRSDVAISGKGAMNNSTIKGRHGFQLKRFSRKTDLFSDLACKLLQEFLPLLFIVININIYRNGGRDMFCNPKPYHVLKCRKHLALISYKVPRIIEVKRNTHAVTQLTNLGRLYANIAHKGNDAVYLFFDLFCWFHISNITFSDIAYLYYIVGQKKRA